MASFVSRKMLGPDDALQAYALQIARFPMLTPAEEKSLSERFRATGDRGSFDRLVESHLRYVLKIAMGYRGYGLPVADLVGEGTIGLMRAVERFEPARGFRLATFGLWWIKALIQEYVLKNWSMVKIGTTADQKKIFFNMKKVKRKLGIDGFSLSPDDSARLAKAMGVSEREVNEMDTRLMPSVSTNAPVSHGDDESRELQDMLPSPLRSAEDILVESDETDKRTALIGDALVVLQPRELEVFKARRLAETPRTLEDLGVQLGVSRERVRQIEVAAFSKVQRHVVRAAAAMQ